MRDKKKKQFFCVSGETPEEFQDNMNDVICRYYDPEVTYAPGVPYVAYVLVTTWERVPETVADIYDLKGERYLCYQCPKFVKSHDMRRKWHWCEHKKEGCHIDSPACEKFYEWLEEGEIKKPERREWE